MAGVFTVRLPDETRALLTARAEAENTTSSELARRLIADGVEHRPLGLSDLIRLAFVGTPGLHEVWIVGSYAARLAGEDIEPADVDLLIVADQDVDRGRLERSAAELSLAVGRSVDLIFRTPESLAAGKGQVTRTLLNRPRFRVAL